MKKFITLFTSLLFLSGVAFASGNNNGPQVNGNSSNEQEQTQSQAQGQNQGQAQGQISKNTNFNSVKSTNINKSNSSSTSGASSDNNVDVAIEGDSIKIPRQVSTAYAAGLVASADTCMGSLSGGAQTGLFGISAASTVEGQHCIREKNITRAFKLGMTDVGVALWCQDETVKEAMMTAGKRCPADKEVKTSSNTFTSKSGECEYPTANGCTNHR